MNYYILFSVICGILLIVLAIWLLLRKIKQLKKRKTDIPLELLKKFEECERRLEKANGEITPHNILWDVITQGRYRKPAQTDASGKPKSDSKELCEQPGGQQDIQSLTDRLNRQTNRSNKQPPSKNRRSFSSRFRRGGRGSKLK